MNVLSRSEIEERLEVDSIRDKPALSFQEKLSIFTNLQSSFALRTQSSLTTAFTVTNSMIGTSILIMPLNFIQSGVITSIIALLVVGFLSFKTSGIIIHYSKRGEYDFSSQINRILGKRMRVVYIAACTFLLVGVGLTYFILMCNVFYSILSLIFPDLPSKEDGITFKTFSYPYTGVLLGIVGLPLFAMKNLKFILKITSLGVYALFFYMFFCMYIGIAAIVNGQVKFGNAEGAVKWYSFDFVTILAVFGLSFEIQHGILPMVKYNVHQDKNTRDVGFGFILGGIIYFLVGFFGAIGVSWRPLCGPGHDPETIMDCITNEDKFTQYYAVASEAFIFIHLLTIQPIVCYITRSQVLNYFYGELNKIPTAVTHLFNIVFVAIMVACVVVDLHPTTAVSIVGSVGGFVVVYLAPIAIVFKYKGVPNKSIVSGSSIDPLKAPLKDQIVMTFEEHSQDLGVMGSEVDKEHPKSGIQLPEKNQTRSVIRSKKCWYCKPRLIFYAIVLAFGTAVMLLVLENLIYGIFKK